jgi:threonine/homoserine/homoserine lactone efflux protein
MSLVSGQQLVAFGIAAFVIIAIPGPSVLFVIGRALTYGRTVALLSVLGNSLGMFVVMALVALGLGPVVAESFVVFTTIKLAGAAYMIWLGVQAFRHRRAIRVEDGELGGPALPWPRALRQGFVVGVSNPKAFMMFAAVLPQFVEPEAGHVTGQMFVLGLLAFTIGLLGDSLWGVLAAQLRHWFNASPKRGRALGAAGGASMVGLGIGLALTGRPD